MQPAIRLRQKIAGSAPTLGVLIANHLWLELIEVAMEAGLDYVIIDSEHLDHGAQLIADACRLGRLAGFPVLLRPAQASREAVQAAMDLGPCGLLLPMVESAEQLDAVQEGVYLPPRGNRRPGGPGNRWVRQYRYEDFKTQVEDHLIILPQVESLRGLHHAKAIAQHPLTTALAVGPFDLAARLGCCFQFDHPDYQAAIRQLRHAAEEAGKPLWMIGDGPSLLREGHRFLCIAEPTLLLQASLKRLVDDLRAAADVKKDGAVPAADRRPRVRSEIG
ncbi:MAG TPA: aldolase/citrate lyase family protein [Phycisphaeraceae bacterium]